MKEAMDNIKNLGGKKMAILGAAGAALMLGIVIFASSVSDTAMSPLYSNMSLEDSNKIATELDSKNVKYEITGSGTSILVPSENVLRLRMEFAEQGLPSQGSVIGYEIFDRQEKLGSSSFVQNVNQVRALEGELSRTIGSMQKIRQARVHLVLPKREIFNKEGSKPSASIQITMKGAEKLSQGEINAVRYLVASAVPGLSAENVTVVDSRGFLYAKGGSNPDDPAVSASNSQEYKSAVESQYKARIEDLLEQYVGMGKVKAQVTADINFDREVTNSEVYDPEGQVARSVQTSTETEASKESEAGAATGGDSVSVAGNLPNGAAAAGASGAGTMDNREKSDEITNYEISKTVKNHVSESGRVNKLSVAVMIDGIYTEDAESGESKYTERSKEELAKLEALVKSSVGFDAKRGDIIEVASMKFSNSFGEEKTSAFSFVQQDLQSVVQILVMGLVAAMVIMMVVRPLVKRALEVQAQQNTLLPNPTNASAGLLAAPGVAGVLPAPAKAIAAPGVAGGGVAAALAAGAGGGSGMNLNEGGEEDDGDGFSMIGGIRASKPNSIKKINEVINNSPDEALQILRSWMYGSDAA